MAPPVLRILIVDDNPVCFTILRRMIVLLQPPDEIIKFEITVVHSAEEALCNLKKTCYDIIFTDIEMTGMRGDDMVKVIRHNLAGDICKENQHIPIIAITSKYDKKSLSLYEEAGITDCLEKPAKSDSIHSILKDRLDKLTT